MIKWTFLERKKYLRIQNWSPFVSTWSRCRDNGDQRLVIHRYRLCSICLAKLPIGEFGEKYVVLFATVSSPKLTMTKRMNEENIRLTSEMVKNRRNTSKKKEKKEKKEEEYTRLTYKINAG